MAIALEGLRLKPIYEQLINVAVSDGLEHTKFLNRNAQLFLRNGFVLSQHDGEGARIMEEQKRHIKEVYMDPALKPLASEPGSESISILLSKSAHTQNTQTEGINEMSTQSVKAKERNGKAEYYDLFGNDMEPPIDLDDASSSDGQQVDMINHFHVGDYLISIRDIKNDYMLRGMEPERRMQATNGNNNDV